VYIYRLVHTLSSQELGLSPRILGVYQTSGVDLDLVHVNAVGANLHEHLVAITSRMRTVGGGEVVCVWPVFPQQRIWCEVGSVSTSRENDRAIHRSLLAVEAVCDSSGNVTLQIHAGDLGLLDKLNALRLGLGELLESLHQSVCDGHTGELGIVATVRSGLGVAANQSQCEFCTLMKG